MIKKMLILIAVLAISFPALVMASGPGEGLEGSHHDFTAATGEQHALMVPDPTVFLEDGETPDPAAPLVQAEDSDGNLLWEHNMVIGAIGLCTTCHTPHKALDTRLLWNHKLSTNVFAWTDQTTTIGGTEFPTVSTAWNGPTKYCLSCHDGSVAVGDIAWFDGGKPDITNTMRHDGANDPARIAAGAEMKGNHPVAFPYPFGQVANTYNNKTTNANVIMTEFNGDPQNTGPGLKGIRLFTQTGVNVTAGATAGDTNVGIECSSCHDPHNVQTEDHYFLRGKLEWSADGADLYICTKCHTKS